MSASSDTCDFKMLNNDELRRLIVAATTELTSRENSCVRIEIEFDSYNQYRFSKPWIARVVDWPVGGHCELRFGVYQGDADGGFVEITANIGDVVRWGQKSSSVTKTFSRWGIVQADGRITRVSQAVAFKAFRDSAEPSLDTETLGH
ncbi:MAG: hypothetical protein FHP92_20710 [Denitromonas halophila]|nr:MAG: hypothetical protein FHP94_20475 [Denitromonas halophila]TVT63636.1 MAG: hypothetical protein FHP93_20600 [Denitromonas halophila]TVT68043.1 MAG: hypothetical protein FHP92_20710 [Denitromonas halophila]